MYVFLGGGVSSLYFQFFSLSLLFVMVFLFLFSYFFSISRKKHHFFPTRTVSFSVSPISRILFLKNGFPPFFIFLNDAEHV